MGRRVASREVSNAPGYATPHSGDPSTIREAAVEVVHHSVGKSALEWPLEPVIVNAPTPYEAQSGAREL